MATESWIENQVLFTAYYAKNRDPHHDKETPKNDIKYIKPWYENVNRLAIQGRVLHDGLSQDFIDKYTTEYVKFIEVENNLGLAVHDHRYFAFLKYLEENEHIGSAFLTDGNDVIVAENPFEVPLAEGVLYVGSEARSIEDVWKWLIEGQGAALLGKMSEAERAMNKSYFWDIRENRLINSGIVGGNREALLGFLEDLTHLIAVSDANIGHIVDMAAFNYLCYKREYQNRFVTDAPVHSVFMDYEYNRDGVWFIHK